jgi:hypothetical protein
VENIERTKQIKPNGKYPIYIFDVAHCESHNHEKRSTEKTNKYRPTIDILNKEGHNTTFTPIIIGSLIPLNDTDIHIYTENLGLTQELKDKLHQKIWKSHLHHLHNISKQYRQLEHAQSMQHTAIT